MKRDTMMHIGIMIVLAFLAISLFYNASKSCDVIINYKVSVDSAGNSTTPNLPEVQLACYKICVEELRGDSSMMRTCLDKCEALGDKNE